MEGIDKAERVTSRLVALLLANIECTQYDSELGEVFIPNEGIEAIAAILREEYPEEELQEVYERGRAIEQVRQEQKKPKPFQYDEGDLEVKAIEGGEVMAGQQYRQAERIRQLETYIKNHGLWKD